MNERPRQHHGGDDLPELDSQDANEILTEKPADGAGPGPDERPAIGEPNRPESPAGLRNVGAAGDDMAQGDMSSVGGAPAGAPSGGSQEGAFASATYNERGRIVGPDSPAGDIPRVADGEAQGDDLANQLGGGEGGGAGGNWNTASGDMEPASADETGDDRLEAAGSGGPDAGSPGGMGGVRSRPSAYGRPPGGVSPVQPDREEE